MQRRGRQLPPACCWPSSPSAARRPPAAAQLTLYVAASLSDAIEAATAEYNAGHPEITFTQSNGSSTALRTQIEQGAPADMLLSADIKNPQALFDGGLADGGPMNFAANRLAIVVPKGNPAGLTSRVRSWSGRRACRCRRRRRANHRLHHDPAAEPRGTARRARPTSPRPMPPTSSRARRTSARCWPRWSWARRTPPSSTRPTRDRRQGRHRADTRCGPGQGPVQRRRDADESCG